MRVAVWGAGAIGTGVARRLVTMPAISQVRWINRTSVDGEVLDLEHGLAFAPTCHHVSAHRPEEAAEVLSRSDLVVLTLGVGVRSGGTRADVFPANRNLFADVVLPALTGFSGVVLVVTNPVDLMAREVGTRLPDGGRRVMGLGTVVETARLRAALSSSLRPRRRPQDIDAFAVGTHDEHFVPVAVRARLCPSMDEQDFADAVAMATKEVASGAREVKRRGAVGTVHPIVEGARSGARG